MLSPTISNAPQSSPSASMALTSSQIASPPPTSSGSAGERITFTSGPLGGLTLSAKLSELQGAQLGRKSGTRDRRALDPPPVVVINLYRVLNTDSGTDTEVEIADYSTIFAQGLVCYFDLFAVVGTDIDPSVSRNTPSETDPHAVAIVGEQRITEADKCTQQLAGTTFVPAHIVPYREGHALMFIFADTSVKTEGVFIPRYRCFDVFSTVSGANERPILAECLGTPFRVYSTKTCPVLPPSTSLTKLLSRVGVRVNVRESTRTVRSKKRGKAKDGSSPIREDDGLSNDKEGDGISGEKSGEGKGNSPPTQEDGDASGGKEEDEYSE